MGKLEQLEHLRSENIPMIIFIIDSYWIPIKVINLKENSQKL